MIVKFGIRGRLGNAIFRYMASSIICIIFNATYSVYHLNHCNIDMTDQKFLNIVNHILNNKNIDDICQSNNICQSDTIIMNYYYKKIMN